MDSINEISNNMHNSVYIVFIIFIELMEHVTHGLTSQIMCWIFCYAFETATICHKIRIFNLRSLKPIHKGIGVKKGGWTHQTAALYFFLYEIIFRVHYLSFSSRMTSCILQIPYVSPTSWGIIKRDEPDFRNSISFGDAVRWWHIELLEFNSASRK